MGNLRNVLASNAIRSIVLAAAIFAPPKMFGQDQEQAPAHDVSRPKAIRTQRLRIPADFLKQEAVRFERARIDPSGSIVADGHSLSLYGVVLLRRNRICNSEEGARWTCGLRAFLALRELLEGKSITCRFMHVTMPPKTICWVGDIDITLFLLSQGWAEIADDMTEATYVEAVASAQSKKVGIWGGGSP
jgi:endonuclease YncB( thermonuclease family)